MLSSKAKYALRAVVHLAARTTEGTWLLAANIAATELIPKKFLEAILVELRDAGIIESRRGRNGGYRLTQPPERIMAGDIIRIIDGPLALTSCTSRTRFGPCNDCVSTEDCALRPVLQEARDAIAGVLDSRSIAVMVESAPRERLAGAPTGQRRTEKPKGAGES